MPEESAVSSLGLEPACVFSSIHAKCAVSFVPCIHLQDSGWYDVGELQV